METSFKVLIFPWLAHGHVFPYFELSKKLANKNFHVFYCSTPVNLTSIRKNFNQNDTNFPIELIEIHLPNTIADLDLDHDHHLPPHQHTTKGLPNNKNPTLIRAFELSKARFSDIVDRLKPDLLIYDSHQPWAVECANNIPSVHFVTSGAASISYVHHVFKYQDKPLVSYPFPEIFLTECERKMKTLCPERVKFARYFLLTSFKVSKEIVLIKSCGEIEGKYLGYLSSLSGKKMVSLGPLIHEPVHVEEDDFRVMNWLNGKNPSSVVFVSFGSESYLSEEMMGELAHGLELSGVNFIWAVKFPGTGDDGENSYKKKISEVFPEGFLERTKERGMIIEGGWAPQTKILQHKSTAGFVSHCGWNSVIESLYYGVPLIGMPLQYDQPTNCRLVVGLGVGKEVVKDEINGKWRRGEIGKVIKETAGDIFLKRKAKELSQKLKMVEDELINEGIEELRMICFKNMQQPIPNSNS